MTTFIIRNIVTNAIKFTKEGGSIKIFTMRNKRNAFIIIKDDGVGISKDNLAKLFKDDINVGDILWVESLRPNSPHYFKFYGKYNISPSGIDLVLWG